MNPEKNSNTKTAKPEKPVDATPQSMLSSDKVQAFSMAIFSLLALAFFSMFAIKPTLNSFFQLQREIEDAKTLDKELTSKIRLLLRAQEEYYEYQEELTLLDDALPPEPEFPQLLSKIEAVTAEEHTPIVSFTTKDFSLLDTQGPQVKASNDDLTDLLFTLELAAPYQNSEALIERLINLRRIILFDRIAITENSTSHDTDLEIEITAKAFHIGKDK